MQRPLLFTRSGGIIVAALLAVAALQSPARAQLPSDLQEGPPAGLKSPLGDESSETTANCLPHLNSLAESPPEDPFAGSLCERSVLTGDWLGRRSRLEESGITLDVSTTQFYQGVTAGGLEQGFRYGGRNDYFLNLDGEKLGLWNGASVTLHGETRYGDSVNSLAGTLSAPNLLLALPQRDGTVTALTGVTFTQDLTDELIVYGGKFNTFDDVEQPLTGATSLTGFQSTAMLYNPVYARTIPYSTFGAGLTFLHNEESEFSLIVYDTNDTPTEIGFDTFFDNGVTLYAEWIVGTTFTGRPGHHGLSGTYSSGMYTNLTPTAYLDPIEGLVIVTTLETGSWCLAYNFDQALYVLPDDPERMWGVFGNFGIADENPSPVRWFASLGISGASPFAGREADTFGVAYYYLGVSDPLKNLAPLLLPLRDEYGVEMYYNVAVTPWCQITPDLQVLRPFRAQADTSMLLGVRAKVDF
jgi:porin